MLRRLIAPAVVTTCVVLLVLLAAMSAAAGPAARFPVGKFRTWISEADLKRGHANPSYIDVNLGTYTLSLTPGRFKIRPP